MPEQIGILEESFATEQITERFSKKEFILKIPGSQTQYDQLVKFQLVNDKTDLLNPYSSGEQIKVHYNLRGKKTESNGQVKYYNSLDVWKIERG